MKKALATVLILLVLPCLAAFGLALVGWLLLIICLVIAALLALVLACVPLLPAAVPLALAAVLLQDSSD